MTDIRHIAESILRLEKKGEIPHLHSMHSLSMFALEAIQVLEGCKKGLDRHYCGGELCVQTYERARDLLNKWSPKRVMTELEKATMSTFHEDELNEQMEDTKFKE